jgi:hypothetical protein
MIEDKAKNKAKNKQLVMSAIKVVSYECEKAFGTLEHLERWIGASQWSSLARIHCAA